MLQLGRDVERNITSSNDPTCVVPPCVDGRGCSAYVYSACVGTESVIEQPHVGI